MCIICPLKIQNITIACRTPFWKRSLSEAVTRSFHFGIEKILIENITESAGELLFRKQLFLILFDFCHKNFFQKISHEKMVCLKIGQFLITFSIENFLEYDSAILKILYFKNFPQSRRTNKGESQRDHRKSRRRFSKIKSH